MPLLPGKKNIGKNIETEMASGKKKSQAIAIALNVARKASGGAVGYAEGGAPDDVTTADILANMPKATTAERALSWLQSLSEKAHGGIDSTVRDLQASGAHPRVGPLLAHAAVNYGLDLPASWLKAYTSPSVENVGDAALQTAMGSGRAKTAAAIGSGLFGNAAANDLGLFGMGAKAATLEGLSPAQNKELEDLRTKNTRYKWKNDREREEGQARIKQLEDIANDFAKTKNKLALETANIGEANKVAEYNRAVKTAESARDAEFAKDKRFSDTDIGRLYDKYGIATPALIAAGAGGLTKMAGAKSYGPSMAVGAGTGAVAANWPLMYNSYFTEPDNPKRAGYEAYVRELPDSHPDKQKWSDYAQTLPKANPLQEVSRGELYDPMKLAERSGIGALEGLLAGLAGGEATKLPGIGLEFAGSLPGRYQAGKIAGQARMTEESIRKQALDAQLAKMKAPSHKADALLDEAATLEAGAMPRFQGQPAASPGAGPMAPVASANPAPVQGPLPAAAVPANPPAALPPPTYFTPAENLPVAGPLKQAPSDVERMLSEFKLQDLKPGKSGATKHNPKGNFDSFEAQVERFRKQALEALRKERDGKKYGGAVDAAMRIARAMGGRVHTGPITQRADGGRTDTVPMDVPEGAYVIPADIVSALGQGDTTAGMKSIGGMFGPHDEPGAKQSVPILAAGGEYVMSPSQVARLANGDLAKAHAMLDQWVKATRAKNIETLANLPGPQR